jgi:fibronectin type 3 domain-containing protein
VALSGLTGSTLYHVRVRSRDAAGNLAVSGDVTFTTLDGTAPTVSITAPAAGATVSGTSVTVSATASDNVGVVGVQFKLDGANVGAEDTTNPYSVSWNSTTASNGNHTLTAVARDAAGNQTTSAGVTVTVSNTPVTLVAAYGYDEGSGAAAADASVNRNTATVSQTTWSPACRFGNCLAFNGTTSFVDAPDLDVLTLGTEATFEAWVVLTAAPTELASVINKWSQTTDDEYLFGINPARTALFGWHTTGGDSWGTSSFNAASGTGTIPLDTLTHVAIVRSGATLTFYINGTLDAALPVMDSQPFRNGSNTLRVGGQARGAQNRFFPGRIDEVHIYARALTQAEIQTDMNTPITPDTTPPILSAISASAVTASAATFTWTTNELSDSEVEYGPTTAYGGFSALDVTKVTAHTVNLSGLTPSTLYHYRVRSRDAAGNLALSPDATFTTLEGIPPTVSITAPANGATVSGTINVTATAADNVGVAGVQFQRNGAPLGAEDTSAPYAVSWNTTTASDGVATLTAIARDAAGNRTTSAAILVTVANLIGEVTLAWDANTEADLAGYRVYVGTTAGVYVSNVDVGNVTTYTVTGLSVGQTYFFAVTAYNDGAAESGYSNEVSAAP